MADDSGSGKVLKFPASGMSPFVKPETVKLDLGWDNHFIIVRKRLAVGAVKELQSAGIKWAGQDGKTGEPIMGLDMPKMALARVTAYVVDWSFRTDTNKPIAVTPQAIANLNPEVFDLIDAKLDEHVTAQAAEKNELPGATEQPSN
jgi:hypothetical protein